jgi:hypothetical protein
MCWPVQNGCQMCLPEILLFNEYGFRETWVMSPRFDSRSDPFVPHQKGEGDAADSVDYLTELQSPRPLYYKSPNIIHGANNVLVDAQLSIKYFIHQTKNRKMPKNVRVGYLFRRKISREMAATSVSPTKIFSHQNAWWSQEDHLQHPWTALKLSRPDIFPSASVLRPYFSTRPRQYHHYMSHQTKSNISYCYARLIAKTICMTITLFQQIVWILETEPP